MKKIWFPMLSLSLLTAIPGFAQDNDSEKAPGKISEYDEIVIKPKDGNKDGKFTVEIHDGQVTVNGKPIDQFEDQDFSVQKRIQRRIMLNGSQSPFRSHGGPDMFFDNEEEDRPLLGVTTEKSVEGVKVQGVSDNSAADKAGIKEGDVITKVGDKKIENPQQLSEVIATYKPKDKIAVTIKRDGKESKVDAVLGKRQGGMAMTFPRGNMMPDMQEFRFEMPGQPGGNMLMFGNGPRLGIRAQDTEDGKGVKVLDVNDDSPAAKAGIKENDIITSLNDRKVNSADELADAYRDARDQSSFKMSVTRNGKSSVIEVKIPKKLKTANL